jgi:hypothetical protein
VTSTTKSRFSSSQQQTAMKKVLHNSSRVPSEEHCKKSGSNNREPDHRNNEAGEMPIYVAAPGLHCVSFRRPCVVVSAASIVLAVGAAVSAAVAPAVVAVMVMVVVDRACARLRDRIRCKGCRQE